MDEMIAAAITGVLAFLAGLVVNSQGRFQFFSSTVSSERMVWIKDIRELCTDLCAVCEQYDADHLPEKRYADFLKARNGILIRLDPVGWYSTDDELIELLKEPDFARIKENLPRIRNLLMSINKTEWDKVKIEAGNSPWKVKKIEGIQNRLLSDNFHGHA